MDERMSTTPGSESLFIMPPNLIASIYWDVSKGQRLKSLRGRESMQSLAKRAGVAWQLIQRLEKSLPNSSSKSGKPPTVTWETLESLCRALSVRVEDFLQIQTIRDPKNLSETP
jgi:DNA-binding Xre family transcriptional regulator